MLHSIIWLINVNHFFIHFIFKNNLFTHKVIIFASLNNTYLLKLIIKLSLNRTQRIHSFTVWFILVSLFIKHFYFHKQFYELLIKYGPLLHFLYTYYNHRKLPMEKDWKSLKPGSGLIYRGSSKIWPCNLTYNDRKKHIKLYKLKSFIVIQCMFHVNYSQSENLQN